jgi:hypothetical protein
LLIASILVVQLILYWFVSSQSSGPRRAQIASPLVGYGERPAPEQHSGRPVYPFSVIRGGAYNAVELQTALDSDPVAARHYAVFRRAGLHTVVLKVERRAYVSFRVGGAVYWTRHRVGLVKGETLLTDGEFYARARCGNRISDIPQEPTTAREPRLGVLDAPEVPIPGIPQTETYASLLPALAPGAEIFPAFDLLPPPATTSTPLPVFPPTRVKTKGPPAETPEPGSFLMMVSAAGVIVTMRARRPV